MILSIYLWVRCQIENNKVYIKIFKKGTAWGKEIPHTSVIESWLSLKTLVNSFERVTWSKLIFYPIYDREKKAHRPWLKEGLLWITKFFSSPSEPKPGKLIISILKAVSENWDVIVYNQMITLPVSESYLPYSRI